MSDQKYNHEHHGKQHPGNHHQHPSDKNHPHGDLVGPGAPGGGPTPEQIQQAAIDTRLAAGGNMLDPDTGQIVPLPGGPNDPAVIQAGIDAANAAAQAAAEKAEAAQDVRDQVSIWLQELGLPPEFKDIIEDAITKGKGAAEIRLIIENSQPYHDMFPEIRELQAAGYSKPTLAEIRAARNQIGELIKRYKGADITQAGIIAQIRKAVGKNVSPVEFEKRLIADANYKQFGPIAEQVFLETLGYVPDVDRMFEFFLADVPTPELDRAYRKGLFRATGQPLGVNMSAAEEEELLKRTIGFDINESFRNYAKITAEMPKAERLKAIQNAIAGAQNLPQEITNVAFGTLYRAAFLQDADAIRELQELTTQETARFTARGGALQQGTQLTGLLRPEERRREGRR